MTLLLIENTWETGDKLCFMFMIWWRGVFQIADIIDIELLTLDLLPIIIKPNESTSSY